VVTTASTSTQVSEPSQPQVTTNEIGPATAPEPLPSFVPGQVKASARTVQPPISVIVPPSGNRNSALPGLLLMLGGGLLGASAVGAFVFFRKVRNAKQPSIISQSFDRY
jgi:hypothetical protein